MDQPTPIPLPPTPTPNPPPPPAPVVAPVVHHSPLPWILLVIVLLVGVGFGSYLLGRQNTATPYMAATPTIWPTPEPIVVPDPTASWPAYETQYWSFKLPPPQDYFICNTNQGYVSTYIPDKDGIVVSNHVSECNFGFGGLFNISRQAGDYALPITTAPDQNGSYTTVENLTNITVDGKPATQLEENVYGDLERKTIQVYVIHDNVTDNLTLNDVSQKTTFDLFLSTIKFK